ncbi:hypothetical protein MFUR16E_04640 [Methylobacterium fujisawaense]
MIAPKSLIDDELRMARLEEYLEAAFPQFSFIMAPENNIPGNQSAVGVMLEKDGTNPFSDSETEQVTSEVMDAMTRFIDMKRRSH